MEIILAITLTLSLVGNFFQHKNAEKLQETASSNYEAYLIAKTANEDYEYIISDIESSNQLCTEDLKVAINKFDRWEDAERINTANIKDLEERLSSIDYDVSCIVPTWVDFEAK